MPDTPDIPDTTQAPAAIDPAPEAPTPNHTRPQFVPRAFAFMQWQTKLREQANALAQNLLTNAQAAYGYARAALGFAQQAEQAKADAQAAANTIANSPTASGTTADMLTISPGAKAFTTQAGKAFVVGQQLVLASASNPTSQRLWGIVTAYNPGTGAMALTATHTIGHGSASSWAISVATPPAQGALIVQRITANTAAQPGIHYELATPGITLTMPAVSGLATNDEIGFSNTSNGDCIVAWSGTNVRGQAPETPFTIPPQGSARVIFSGEQWL